jgi:hypothetical protein
MYNLSGYRNTWRVKLMRSLMSLIAVCSVFAVFSGCASTAKIHTVVSHDYNFDQLKRVGITKFDNTKQVGGIEDYFAQEMIDRGFITVERNSLQKVLAEQKIGASGLFDQATTKKLGQLLGIDALMVGEVTFYSPKQNKTHMEEEDKYFSVPVYKKVPVWNGNGYTEKLVQTGTNTKVEKHKYPVTETTNPKVGIVAKIIDTQTAEIVWVGSILDEGDNVMDIAQESVHLMVKALWKDIKMIKKEHAK